MSNAAEKFITLADYRDQVIRQDRVTDNIEIIKVKINDAEYQVFNYSKFGIGIIASSSTLPLSGIAKIFVHKTAIYEGAFEVAHQVEVDGKYRIGLALKGFIELEKINGIVQANKIHLDLHQEMKVRASLDTTYVSYVDKMFFYLSNLKKKVDEVEKITKEMLYDDREKYVSSFINECVFSLEKDFFDFHKVLNSFQDISGDKPKPEYLKYAQDMLTPFFLDSELGKRIVEKPLGYAGDYEMMNQIYRATNEAKTLFGNIIHKHLVEARCSQSVRYRIDLLTRYFQETLATTHKEEKYYSLSVASGPARELQAFLKSASPAELSKCHFGLLDLDKGSLKYAQSCIKEILISEKKDANLSYINDNVIYIALGRTKPLPANTYNFIYSAGLYDYLDLKLSTLLTHKLYESLKPGGKLVIGNFSRTNPEKVFVDLILDWYLIHKTDEEMMRMVPVGADATIQHDPNGIISYLNIVKRK